MSVPATALLLAAQITSAQPADPGSDGAASADRMLTSTSGGAERLSSQSIADAALVGIWQGSLQTGPFELRLVLNVRSTTNGAFAATLDSLDQGVLGIPVSTPTAIHVAALPAKSRIQHFDPQIGIPCWNGLPGLCGSTNRRLNCSANGMSTGLTWPLSAGSV